ncbi:asparagine synthase (glutamine-hydrolyzing) [Desulfovibrio sp.]|uniref:asparagine synthase (glutamine-hydrolyzing) n=1 Tax=Desulfovibrio sp. TaxID=885 RepID=UPI0025BA4C11|nr:asparagine synthase (glutamine-hydrolyzing) [Desulfovibrio sp.]
MCGIFGFISDKQYLYYDIVADACTMLRRRGPDDSGIVEHGCVTFGHRRLSIVDAAGGKQPMSSSDGRYLITFNGEIYNHNKLRNELRAMDYSFSTNSDTETLLYAFVAWKENCLAKLRGMFAFAIADFERREVFLARDIFGIKPLLYRMSPDFFAFSSELPPLAQMRGIKAPAVNIPSVAQFFRYQYISAPYSIYEDIYKLPPAHAMRVGFDGQIHSSWCYKDFDFSGENTDFQEAVTTSKGLIADVVTENTMADVPIGVFLSGGIDSTLVAMNLAQHYGCNIPAFTINFSEQAFSEIPYAQEAAKHLGLKLTVEVVESMAIEKLPEILSFYGEPFGDSSVLPTWHVARLARQSVPVVLSGDGGDELFGGYQSHAAWLSAHQTNHLSEAVRAAIAFRAGKLRHHLRFLWQRPKITVEFWHQFIQYNNPTTLGKLLTSPYRDYRDEMAVGFASLTSTKGRIPALDIVQLLDIKTYLPECILPKVDVASMQHGLEVRPALLDVDILDFARHLAPSCRVRDGYNGKAIFKQILLDAGFSKEFVFRQKQGFGIPVDIWFLKGGEARNLLEDLLDTYKTDLEEFLNLGFVYGLLKKHTLRQPFGSKLWLVLAFSCWISQRKMLPSK